MRRASSAPQKAFEMPRKELGCITLIILHLSEFFYTRINVESFELVDDILYFTLCYAMGEDVHNCVVTPPFERCSSNSATLSWTAK